MLGFNKMSRESITICPKCGTNFGFKPAEIESNNTGCLIFLFGGFLPYLLFNSNRENMVVCTRCGYVFSPPSHRGKGELIFVAIVFALLLGIVMFFVLKS